MSVFLVTIVATEGFCFDASYDIRKEGYAPTVRDQGNNNTCWTFATMAAMESNYLKQTQSKYEPFDKFLGDNYDLSELHLAWYSFKNSDNKKNFAYTRSGRVIQPTNDQILKHAGNPQMALAFLSRHDGPVRESDLPYESALQGVYPAAGTSPRDYKSVLRVIGANYIDPTEITIDGLEEAIVIGKEELLKAYLMAHGAISTGVYWDTNYMNRQNYAYYNTGQNGGHAVTIIGWDDNYSRDNFSPIKPEKDGAWLVQNSWGPSWGNDGCFWMSYEQVLRYAMVFEIEEANPRVREYYHDALGFTHELEFPKAEDKIIGTANVFKVKGDHEKLREIGFYSTNGSYKATTLVFDLGTDNSLENFSSLADENMLENMTTLDVYEGISERGYLVRPLIVPMELSKDHYFAILTVLGPSDLSSADFKPTIAIEAKIPNYRTANAEVNAQETYFLADGDKWQDAKYYTFRIGANEITGFNACVKGFSYVPDERFADDWTLISSDGKAQLSISLLKETEPRAIAVTGTGIENIFYKVERENASTGDAKGSFYKLKLICDLLSDDAKLTSLKINSEEVLRGSIRNNLYDIFLLSQDQYINISKVGVSFKDMTQASGVIESTDGYTVNGESSSGNDNSNNNNSGGNDNSNNNNDTVIRGGGTGGSSGGCNSVFSVLSLIILSSALVLKRKVK